MDFINFITNKKDTWSTISKVWYLIDRSQNFEFKEG